MCVVSKGVTRARAAETRVKNRKRIMASGPLSLDLASVRNMIRLNPPVDALRIAEAVENSSKLACHWKIGPT